MSKQHTGSCLCEKVSFKTRGKLRNLLACHCSQCRKQTGFYYAATDVNISDVEIIGENHVTWYKASETAKRGFCSHCGSALFWKANGLDRISILAGAFDAPTELKIDAHIFCEDKGDFYEITDGLPQYPKDID